MIKCLNCGNEFEGKFCNNCGQKASTGKLSFKKIVPELWYSLFHFDNGIYNNLKAIFSPRQAVFSYIEGKRKSFLNPFLYALILLGLFTQVVGSFALDLHINIESKSFDAGKYIVIFSKYFLFLAAIFLAFANRIAYRKSHKNNITEHFYIGSFLIGNTALVCCVISPLDRFFDFPFSSVGFIFVVWIFLFAIFRKGRFIRDLLKSLLSLIIGFTFYACLILGVMCLVAYLEYCLQ